MTNWTSNSTPSTSCSCPAPHMASVITSDYEISLPNRFKTFKCLTNFFENISDFAGRFILPAAVTLDPRQLDDTLHFSLLFYVKVCPKILVWMLILYLWHNVNDLIGKKIFIWHKADWFDVSFLVPCVFIMQMRIFVPLL